jgi:hypothetical protein
VAEETACDAAVTLAPAPAPVPDWRALSQGRPRGGDVVAWQLQPSPRPQGSSPRQRPGLPVAIQQASAPPPGPLKRPGAAA